MIYAPLSQNIFVKIYEIFHQMFETEKQTPQTFSLLECMIFVLLKFLQLPTDRMHKLINKWSTSLLLLELLPFFKYIVGMPQFQMQTLFEHFLRV